MADKTHLNRIFTNLIQNALQSVPEDVTAIIEIHQKRDGKNVLTHISDNGSGIEESIRSKIFTPNFTTKTSGTGLGLAMCKRMVEHANGEIWFETFQGTGTTFHISFPIVKTEGVNA
jgi:signal transduction histidine kinase